MGMWQLAYLLIKGLETANDLKNNRISKKTEHVMGCRVVDARGLSDWINRMILFTGVYIGVFVP